MFEGASIKWDRNRSGRWHCYWVIEGRKYEFYAKGRSTKTYQQNLIYQGVTKCVGTYKDQHEGPQNSEAGAQQAGRKEKSGSYNSDTSTRAREEAQARANANLV